MKKAAVIYWSGTGNTEAMANAVLEGMKSAGADAVLLTASDVDASAVGGYDAVALGCPAMGSEVLEDMEFEPMFDGCKASLKGKVIGAQRATIAGTWLEDNLADTVEIKLYDTQENAYLDLSSGRLDGVLADKFVNWEWLKSDAGKDFEFKGEPVFDNDKIAIAVRKGDPLREKLNAALKAIVEDGTYKQINDKYFPFSIY